MLVSWVYAMLGEVGRIVVVEEVVKRSNDRTAEELREGELARGIECCVHADGKESGKESE